jgi:bifunctional DNase/RNase
MVIYGVSFDMVGKQPIVLLKAVDTNKFLPIWIGHPEAAAILMKLQGASTPRPMTHDLLFEMLGELDVSVHTRLRSPSCARTRSTPRSPCR